MRAARREPIAVIGIGCRFPGAPNPTAYWRLLHSGTDAIHVVPAARWDADEYYDAHAAVPGKMNSRWGGFLDDVATFDAEFFGIAPREARSIDPQQRLVLEVAWEALEDAGQPADRLAGSDTGVFIGIYHDDYGALCGADPYAIDTYSGTGAARALAANRLSYFLDLRGPSVTVDTTCSSSLVAVHQACQALWLDECALAMAGGVNVMLSPLTSIAAAKALAMAADGRCKSFDARADGIVRGEGCGVVVLKPLAAAQRDGNRVLAVLHGSAVNQDGLSNGLTAPSQDAQEAVVRRALGVAGLHPDDISYVETHGTGTPLGDPIEVAALASVFARRDAGARVALGAVKTNIGHLEAAAGIAALIKVVLCLGQREIPPNLHFTTPNPELHIDQTPFFFPRQPIPWALEGRRFAGVSAFSIGGTNAHVIVGDAPPATLKARDECPPRPSSVALPLTAATRSGLRRVCSSYGDALDELARDFSIEDVCRAAATGRSQLRHRAVVVAPTLAEMRRTLQRFAAGDEDSGMVTGSVNGVAARPVFVFSGQGCHWPGMGRGLLDGSAASRRVLEECDAALRRHGGRSLIDDVQAADAGRLHQTRVVQPMIFALQLAAATQLRTWGVAPAAVVGHSLGELAAACTAGVFGIDAAMRVIVARSEVMQSLEGRGAMLAVDLDERRTARRIAESGVRLTIAAVNAPGSVVVSGDRQAVERFAETLHADEIPCIRLPVECAFHSHEMRGSGDGIVRACGDLFAADPGIPLVSTVTGDFLTGARMDAEYWKRNAVEPVRFADAIGRLVAWGATHFVEIAPHAVLRRDLHRCLENHPHLHVVAVGRRNVADRDMLLRALARLFATGCAVEWSRVYSPPARHVPLPTYPWERKRHWHEAADAPRSRRVRETPEVSTSTTQYQIEWIPDPERARGSATDDDRSFGQIVHDARTKSAGAIQRFDELATRFAPRVRELCGLYAAHALHVVDERPLAARPQARRLSEVQLDRLRALAAEQPEAGHLTPAEIERRFDETAADFPECADELLVLRTCGMALADVLTGAADPLQLLFAGAMSEPVARLYRSSPFAAAFNPVVAEVVLGAVRRHAGGLVRILEVGAGTGGTTAAILPRLPAERTHYEFTDISAKFLVDARREYSAFPFIRYSLLDIERHPSVQDHRAATWDIVVAANVLHATRDLTRAVDHARALLAPGGLLVVLEGTSNVDWATLTFGLTDGWTKYDDRTLRDEGPLLRASKWRDVLSSRGLRVADIGGSNDRPGCGVVLVASKEERGSPMEQIPSSWLVLADGHIGTAIGEALARSGGASEIWPRERAGLRERVRAWRAGAGPTAAVVHAWSVAAEPVSGASSDARTLDEAAWCASGSVVDVVQGLAHAAAPTRLWVITQDMPGIAGHGSSGVGTSVAWGLGRVIASEHPDLWGGLVDLEPGSPAVQAQAVVDAVAGGPRGEELALRHGVWHVARLRRRAHTHGHAPIRRDGSYLITGGLGGVGLAVAEWLVSQEAGRVVLASRRAADGERGAAIAPLRGRGSEVWTRAVDVADGAAVAALIADAGRPPYPLRGVIHAAGVVDDRVVLHQDWPRFARVLAPKVQGAWHLHRALESQELDWFVLFGSAAAVLGLPGLANYAAANAFLDALAHYRRARNLPAVAVDWSGWTATGMAAAVGPGRGAQWRARGLEPMSVAEALLAFQGVLDPRTPAQVTIARVDWSAHRATYPAGRVPRLFAELEDGIPSDVRSTPQPAGPAATPSPLDSGATLGEPRAVADFIARSIRTALMLDSTYPLPGDTPIMQFGIDSLMAVELRNVLSRATGLDLPSTLIFECPTIAALTSYLVEALQPRHLVDS